MEVTSKKTAREKIATGLITFIYKRYLFVLLFFCCIALISLQFVSKIQIKSDFSLLLPPNYPSVIHMKKMVERVGGLGSLYVTVESDNLDATKKFAKDLVDRMEKSLPPKTFRFIDYNIEDRKRFYESNKYLYIDYSDLVEIRKRIESRVEYERRKANPFFLSIEGDEGKDWNIDDIVEKYKKKVEEVDRTSDGFYIGEDNKLLVIVTKPYGSSTNVDFAKKLMREIELLAKGLNPARYDPSLKINFGGNFKTTLDEYDSIRRDILSTVLLCVLLISLSLFLFFFKFRFIFLISTTIALGTLITFMIASFNIGYLNSQTAFLVSIIIGNGINYGIIFFARYLEERRKGEVVLDSMIKATMTTLKPTFTAALATSASFIALLIADCRGFSQFGFIGGSGMVLCWLTTYTFLPALLTLTEKILPTVKIESVRPRKAYFFGYLAEIISLNPKLIVLLGFFVLSASIFSIRHYVPNALEMDFSKLRNKESLSSGTAILNRRIGKIFSLVLNPAVILADNESQAERICDVVYEKEKILLKDMPYEKMIDKCVSISSFLPTEQEKKIAELIKIKELLDKKIINMLDGRERAEIIKFKDEFLLRKLTVSDLPAKIQKLFLEDDGRIGLMTYVYPSKKYGSIWDGKNLIKFADLIREVKLASGETIYSSGSSVIFADMLNAIARDGPLTTVTSLVAVLLIVLASFKNIKSALYIITNLLLGVIMMGGALAIFGIKLNYFNFIAIPVTFGIGVDYAVNMFARYKLEGRNSILSVIKTTGGAVTLCSITTIIGYSVLIIAKNQALVSFGIVAILGELTTLFAALVFLPVTIILMERKKV